MATLCIVWCWKEWSINKHETLDDVALSWQNAAEWRTNNDFAGGKKNDITVGNEWSQIEILTHIFLKDIRCAGRSFGCLALGCGCAHPAGLHIADRCSASQAWSATGSVCSRKTRRPDAATWCPTRLPLRYFWACSSAHHMTSNVGFLRLRAVNHVDDGVEPSWKWKPS